MQYDIFKTSIDGIRSLDLIDDDNELMVVMTGSKKPVVILNKDDGSIMFKPENFTSTRLEFGLLLLALSNVYTQGDNTMMNPFKAFDYSNEGIIAKVLSNGNVLVTSETVGKDDLQLLMTQWLMSDFVHDSVDPLVGLVGLGRLVEKYEDKKQSNQAETESISEGSSETVSEV